jgi:signal transduction histidine kinase
MHWIDILWPAMGAVSLTLGVLHALIWRRDPRQLAYLAFSVAAVSVAAMAIFELLLMRSTQVAQFDALVRWAMVTMTILLAGLVVFVRLYFRAGSWSLAMATFVGHLLCMVPNFTTGVNLIFLSVDRLAPLNAWDGSTIVYPQGTPNPWMLGWYLTDAVMVAFWVSVVREVRARDDERELLRRAVLICGALTAFVVGGVTCAFLVGYGWLQAPFMVNVPFVGVVLMISLALAGDWQDIHLRMQQEHERAVLREELAHLSRVATMSEMSSSLAHELNQPLTAVLSNAQAALRFLARDPPDLDGVREGLEHVVESDKRASEVIRRLRSMLRKDTGEYRELDVNDVVEETVLLLRSDLVVRNVDVQLELGRDLPAVRADRVQLQQVLLNLVFNACDALGNMPASRLVVVETCVALPYGVEVIVRDHGAGIAQADPEDIFKPFVTSKPEGMGLGLPVCRSLIEAHGGRIWADRNEPRGTRLHFTLPAVA